jgi:hypothetical protein
MAETTDAPRSWVGQAVVVWARAEGHHSRTPMVALSPDTIRRWASSAVA